MQVEGAVAYVTGGSSGLGLATARRLRHDGAEVAVVDRRRGDDWDGAFQIADVADETGVRDAVRSLADAVGSPSIVVNCAGTGTSALMAGSGATLTGDRFRRILDVNTLGTYLVCQATTELMIENQPNDEGERGVIVNTASTVALEGQIGTSAYAASKGAVIAMTLPLARELAEHGIRVMTIAPGIFETPMFGGAQDDMREWLYGQVAFPPRTGRPEEFASLVREIVINTMFNAETVRLDAGIRVAAGESEWSRRFGRDANGTGDAT